MSLIENPTYKQEVAGSSPALPTKNLPKKRNRFSLQGDLAIIFCPSTGGVIHSVLVDACNLNKILEFGHWRITNHSKNPAKPLFYAMCNHLGMHRLVMNPLPRILIDHENHDSLDNRAENLRVASYSLNALNQRRHDGMCVYRRQNRFQVRVEVNQKQHFLGSFVNEQDARNRRDEFLRSQGVQV